ncbi:MAG: DUF5378 family protein [Metamycoplasmataceae bacterium]
MFLGIGFYLAISTAILIIILFFVNPYIKKVTTNYYFYSISSIGCLVYFITYRWMGDIMELIGLIPSNLSQSTLISKAFLLDLCPFISVALPLSLIFDRTRNIAKVLALFGIVGSAITIYGQIIFEKLGPGENSYGTSSIIDYIFFNNLYFAMHWYSLMLSFLVLINSKTFTIKSALSAHLFAAGYFSYIGIFISFFGVVNNATGLVEQDWNPIGGQYGQVTKIFNIPWPYTPILAFSLVWITILIFIFLKNFFTFDKTEKSPKELNFSQAKFQQIIYKKFK